MRDLLFKNLTSGDRKKRVISCSEIADKQGVHSVIRRHFIYILKEIKGEETQKPLPYLYVLKEHNNKEQRERFYCRIKGNAYAAINGKMFLVFFAHSLKISLVSQDTKTIEYS